MIAFVAATHGEQTRQWTCPISITPRQRLPMKGMMLYLDNLKDSQWMGWCILYISSPMSLSIKYTVIKTIKRIMQVFIIIHESFNLSCPINLILKSTKLLQTCFPPKASWRQNQQGCHQQPPNDNTTLWIQCISISSCDVMTAERESTHQQCIWCKWHTGTFR